MAVIKMTIYSDTLRMHTGISVLLPTFKNREDRGILDGINDYVPGMKYQVIYMLHGGAGNNEDYLHYSSIARYADDNKVAVVMPTGYQSFYTDDPNGPKYFSFVAHELPRICETLFPISSKKEDVFIGGLSMGAVGSYKIATAFPERFNSVFLMSGAGRGPRHPAQGIEHTYVKEFALPVTDIIDDPWVYMPKQVVDGKVMPKFYMTCGTEDELAYPDYTSTIEQFEKLGIEHEYKEVKGYKHEWRFWDYAMQDAFYNWLPLKRELIYPDSGETV